jgi:hypothetical protein
MTIERSPLTADPAINCKSDAEKGTSSYGGAAADPPVESTASLRRLLTASAAALAVALLAAGTPFRPLAPLLRLPPSL